MPPCPPPPEPSDASGMSGLFGGLLDQALKQALAMAGWPAHPLARWIDQAEARLDAKGPASTVHGAQMREALKAVLPAQGAPHVRAPGDPRAPADPASPLGTGTLLLVVGDGEHPDRALAKLAPALEGVPRMGPGGEDVVIWTRSWEARAWATRDPAPLAGRAVWLKVWDANGSLIGPVVNAAPPS